MNKKPTLEQRISAIEDTFRKVKWIAGILGVLGLTVSFVTTSVIFQVRATAALMNETAAKQEELAKRVAELTQDLEKRAGGAIRKAAEEGGFLGFQKAYECTLGAPHRAPSNGLVVTLVKAGYGTTVRALGNIGGVERAKASAAMGGGTNSSADINSFTMPVLKDEIWDVESNTTNPPSEVLVRWFGAEPHDC